MKQSIDKKSQKESEVTRQLFNPQIEIKSDPEDYPDTQGPSTLDKLNAIEVQESPICDSNKVNTPKEGTTKQDASHLPAIIITRSVDGTIQSITRTQDLEIPPHMYGVLTPQKGKVKGTADEQISKKSAANEPSFKNPQLTGNTSNTCNIKADVVPSQKPTKSDQITPVRVNLDSQVFHELPDAISPLPDITVPKRSGNVGRKKCTPRKGPPKKGIHTKNSPSKMIPKKPSPSPQSPSTCPTPITRSKPKKEESVGKGTDSIRRSARILAKIDSVKKQLSYDEGDKTEGIFIKTIHRTMYTMRKLLMIYQNAHLLIKYLICEIYLEFS